MQFSVGDKVVHPQHGAGTIKCLTRLNSTQGQQEYYVIEIPVATLSVYVPKYTADAGGIRPAVSEAGLQLILKTLESPPALLSDAALDRQETVLEKLMAGQPVLVAEAVRDLAVHGHRDHLTTVDQRLLRQGLGMLAAEIALVQSIDPPEAIEMIEAILEETSIGASATPDARATGRGSVHQQRG